MMVFILLTSKYFPSPSQTQVLNLPAKSETHISIDFEKSLLKWLEYPPDANHGFYVGSAVISAVLPNRRNFTGIGRRHSSYAEAIGDAAKSTQDAGDTFYQEWEIHNIFVTCVQYGLYFTILSVV
jgi:hypothetical protein